MTSGGHQHADGRADLPVSVALVNDFGHVIAEVEARLRDQRGTVRIVDAEAGADAVGAADVVLFDSFGTRRTALRRLRTIRDSGRHGAFVVSAVDAPELFVDGLHRLGIDVVVPSGLDGASLARVLRATATGDPAPTVQPPPVRRADDLLSGGDAEVVALLLAGLEPNDIADELMRSEATVLDTVVRVLRSLALPDHRALRIDRRLRHLVATHQGERWREFRSEPGQVAAARRFVEDRLRLGNADADTVALFRLAVSELGANAVEYGSGTVWAVGVYGSRDWWSLEVSCEDTGDDQLLRRPWEWAIAAAQEPSGRGLGIVRAVMDEVTTESHLGQLRVICRRRRGRGDTDSLADGPR